MGHSLAREKYPQQAVENLLEMMTYPPVGTELFIEVTLEDDGDDFELPQVAETERKIPVIKNDDYVLYYERTSGMTFAHCDVFNWNKRVYKDLDLKFHYLKWMMYEPIYAIHTINDTKQEKFFRLFGFKPLCYFVDADGEEYELYRT